MGELLRLAPLPTIGELLKLYNVHALKKLSQNFLLQKGTTDKIVNAGGGVQNYEVCEVGPGPGGITRSILLGNARKVIVIEKDKRFRPVLESLQETSNNRLTIIFADVRKYDLSNTFDPALKRSWNDPPPKIQIIGNLPFNISLPLIFDWLKDISLRRNAWTYGRVCLTLTFQEEVGLRMVANVLSKFRNRLSVMCQNWCQVSHKFTIPGRAFLPKPEVNVAVLHFEPLRKPIIDLEFSLVEKFLRTTFNSRQKICFTPISCLFPEKFRKECTEELFRIAEVDRALRPYQLENEEFKRLCYSYKRICDEDPRLYNYDFRGPRATREESWKQTETDSVNKNKNDKLELEN